MATEMLARRAVKSLRPKTVLHDLVVGVAAVLIFIIFGVYWIIAFVFWKVWTIIKSVAKLVSAGTHECVVYFNPKHVTEP